MPRAKLTRRMPTPFTPFLPRPMVPQSTFSSLTRSLDEFRDRTNEMIRSAFGEMPEMPEAPAEWFPAVNVSETNGEYRLTAELPGLSARDVSVDYLDGVLTIRGEKVEEETKEEEDQKYYMWERRFGSFQRNFPFPGGIDEAKINAEFKDGVLTVTMPKSAEAKARRQTIAVTQK